MGLSRPKPEHEPLKFDRTDIAAAERYFREHGYVIFENAFPVAQGAAFWRDVDDALAANKPLTFCVWGRYHTYPEVPLEGRRFPRIVDVESHVPSTYALMLSPLIVDFLTAHYSAAPTCLQTLAYLYSSEQGAHSDKTLVGPPYALNYDRNTLVASWLAMEDSDESNGALVVYPGSHRFRKRGIDDGFDGDYGRYSAYVDELSRANGCMPMIYRARAGEMLFWHSDLVHAGGPITAPGETLPTRRSLVCHYARIPAHKRSGDPGWERVHIGRASYFAKVGS